MHFGQGVLRLVVVITNLLLASGFRYAEPPALHAAILANDWEAVETAASAWMTTVDFPPEAVILRGYAALARGDAKGAVGHFLRVQSGRRSKLATGWAETLATRHPECHVALLLTGDALARRGDQPAALARFDALLAVAPDFALGRLARGLLLAMAGESAAALQDLDAVVGSGALVAEALVTRGLVHLEQGTTDHALAEFTRALSLAPEHAVAYNARGVAYARQGKWEAAARDFATAFRLTPELGAARRNWQIAQIARDRGAVVSAEWHIGIFGTGVRSEAELKYATLHAYDLIPGRPQAFLYVGIKGNFPLAGVEKMKEQGIPTVVVDPRNPQAGEFQVARFIEKSITAGKNPIILIDPNKWLPTQLGNDKWAASGLPAEIAVAANRTFRHEIAKFGGQGISTLAGHSDFTWPATQASILATKQGVPFSSVILESPRSEMAIKDAVRLSPATQFTVVQPIRGDLFTAEAQGRALALQSGAYQKTIETFKNIGAPNYRLTLIENPTPSSGILHLPNAHGDSAQYDRLTVLSVWRGGEQIGGGTGQLGEFLSQKRSMLPPGPPLRYSAEPGGILVGPVHLARGQGGRVTFNSATQVGEELTVVSTLFRRDEIKRQETRPPGK